MPLFLLQQRVSKTFLEYDRIGEKERDSPNGVKDMPLFLLHEHFFLSPLMLVSPQNGTSLQVGSI